MKLRVTATLILGVLALLILAAGALRPSTIRVKKIPALEPGVQAWPEKVFRDGAYCAERRELPADVKAVGSWVGGDGFTGTFTSGWFVARPRVALLVSGYPHQPGNRISVEYRDAAGKLSTLDFAGVNPREEWRPWTVTLPREATAFRVRAVDAFTGFTGWVAMAEPFEPIFRVEWLSLANRTLLAFAVQAILFTALAAAAIALFRLPEKAWLDPRLLPLLGGAAVALAGYLAFWIYFAHPFAGRIFSWTVGGAAGAVLVYRHLRRDPLDWRLLLPPVGLAVLIGIFYVAMLVLYDSPGLSYSAANRFVADLPSDNEIPRGFAERLWKGESPRQLWGDWLSSDRPPLQTGWVLLTWPVLRQLGFEPDVIAGTGGVLFQLLWVPAVWALAGRLGLDARRALALTAAAAFGGVFLMFSVFVWPKFAGAALVVGAYLLLFDRPGETSAPRFAAAGVCAALGWLAHGGVAFSLVVFAPLVLLRFRPAIWWRLWPAAVALVALALPWSTYQKVYEPPGNRLLKWHLAGVVPIDTRPFSRTLVDSYREAGWAKSLANRWSNTRMLAGGDWRHGWPGTGRQWQLNQRGSEMFFIVRSLGVWPLALVAWLLWAWRFQRPRATEAAWAAVWLVGGVIAWLGLMFQPDSAFIHQGTLVTQLLFATLLAWMALQTHRWFFVALTTLQTGWFAVVWLPASRAVTGPALNLPVALIATAGLGLLWIVWRAVAAKDLDRR